MFLWLEATNLSGSYLKLRSNLQTSFQILHDKRFPIPIEDQLKNYKHGAISNFANSFFPSEQNPTA